MSKPHYGIPKAKTPNYGLHLKTTNGYTYWMVRYREGKVWKARTLKAGNEEDARTLRDVFYNYLICFGATPTQTELTP